MGNMAAHTAAPAVTRAGQVILVCGLTNAQAQVLENMEGYTKLAVFADIEEGGIY